MSQIKGVRNERRVYQRYEVAYILCGRAIRNSRDRRSAAMDYRLSVMQTYRLDCDHLAVSETELPIGDMMPCVVCNGARLIEGIAGKPKTQAAAPAPTIQRSYGCSFGCGNPYDYIIVQVVDGTTEFACLPCFVRLASDMVTAVTEGISDGAQSELRELGAADMAPMQNGRVRGRGKNAPADADDPDLIEAFDSRVTVEDLGEEFK